jgi:hypothetical protein
MKSIMVICGYRMNKICKCSHFKLTGVINTFSGCVYLFFVDWRFGLSVRFIISRSLVLSSSGPSYIYENTNDPDKLHSGLIST